MIRYRLLGFVDHDALERHELVLRKTLDMRIVERLVQEMGAVSPEGEISVDGFPFLCHDGGYLTFSSAVGSRKAVDFIVRLAQETGCDIADIELGDSMAPEDFRNHCELMASLIHQTPNPFTK